MKTETTRQQLETITRMIPLIPDVLATTIGLTGISYDPASGCSSSSIALDSPGERALNRSQATYGILQPLDELMHEWAAVRGDTLTGTEQPAQWLHGQTTWAANNYPGWKDAQNIIADIHGRLARITGYGPDQSDTYCPTCLTNNNLTEQAARLIHIQRMPTRAGLPDLWTCPQCRSAWIVTPEHDGLADATRRALLVTHTLTTQGNAASLIGVSRQRLHNWIKRGHLAADEQHRVYLDEAQRAANTFAMRQTTC